MQAKFPEDLVSLFALTLRDTLWFKDRIVRFFESCGVPKSITISVERNRDLPTIKTARNVIDELERKGEEGIKVIQKMFTALADWKDLRSLPPEKIPKARESLRTLKLAIRKYADQKRYQIEKEKEAQKERENRKKISRLDHQKLQEFRDRFDRIYAMIDRQKRGNEFEKLMNEIFAYYCEKSLGPFTRKGEQVDGQFYFDAHYYLVEVRWTTEKPSASDISVLRDRARDSFGGDTRALFISFNGFSQECIDSLKGRRDERVILMDGMDLRCVLNADISFDILLDRKLALAIKDDEPLVSARDVILGKYDN